MPTLIGITSVLLFFSLNALPFLLAYIKLFRTGVRISAVVVGYHLHESIIFRNATIPKLKYKTAEGQEITGKPIHSWFFEFFPYQLGISYDIIYDKNNPNKFVMDNKVELVIGCLILACTLFSLLWLLRDLILH